MLHTTIYQYHYVSVYLFMFIKLIDLDGPINERPSNDLSPGISRSICWELQEQTPIHGLTNNKYVTGQVSRERPISMKAAGRSWVM